VRRFDPTLAAAQIVAADYLKTLAPAAPGEFRERLPKPKQEKIALNWIFDLLESWPKSERLPTSKQLLKLARSQIPGISRENVLSQRTPELTMLRGRPINSRKK
jgi:hypothetical protein